MRVRTRITTEECIFDVQYPSKQWKKMISTLKRQQGWILRHFPGIRTASIIMSSKYWNIFCILNTIGWLRLSCIDCNVNIDDIEKDKEMMTSAYFLKHGGLTAKVPICVKCQESQRGFLAWTVWFYDRHNLGWLITMSSNHLDFDQFLAWFKELQHNCNTGFVLKIWY